MCGTRVDWFLRQRVAIVRSWLFSSTSRLSLVHNSSSGEGHVFFRNLDDFISKLRHCSILSWLTSFWMLVFVVFCKHVLLSRDSP